MSLDDDIRLLERVPTLALLGVDSLRILAIGAESRELHGGDSLFRQGDSADGGYVVKEGSFRLSREGERGNGTVVGEAALVGELALLIETRRPVTAIACEASTVLKIPRVLFLKMLEGYPDAAARLRESIVSRSGAAIREMREIRARLTEDEGGN
jgi:CRP-like cAMP-binding protein